jgi:2-methylcitrate dehydratase PrpD
MQDPIHQIVHYVQSSRYEDLPANVVSAVKNAIVDTVGAAIAGSSAPMGRVAADSVREKGGKPESTLWVYGNKIPAVEAAFANAIMGRCRELDDVHEGSPRTGIGHGGHVSVMIIPAVLATIESRAQSISGKELIVAVAIGGDLIPRIRMAAGTAGRLGWEGSTVAPFGVAAAVGKLLHFDKEVLTNAMGAAYQHCSGNFIAGTDGTWDCGLNVGVGTRAGMIAAEFARRGYQGAKSPFTGVAGLYPLYFRDEYHEAALLSDIGKYFESGNVSTKPYSSCKCTHHAIYTTLELIRKYKIQVAEIERIVIRSCEYNMRITVRDKNGAPKPAPASIGEAQFNMAFTVAMAAIKGTVFSDVLTDDTLKDPDILQLFGKIAIEESALKNELQKKEGYPPEDVDIYMSNGQVFQGCALHVKGHPQNRMTFDEVVEKFWRCVGLSARPLSRKKLDNFLVDVNALDKLVDVRKLTGNLCQNRLIITGR